MDEVDNSSGENSGDPDNPPEEQITIDEPTMDEDENEDGMRKRKDKKKKGKKKKKDKDKRPMNLVITQQTLPSWQPLISIQCILSILLIIFVLFLTIGLLLLIFNWTVVEYFIEYGDNIYVPNKSCKMKENGNGQKVCNITDIELVIEKEMKAPVYFYYQLKGFYQNHRRYSGSRYDDQLAGMKASRSKAKSKCGPIWVNQEDTDVNADDVKDEQVYNPCGLIAWSMYNDTFQLKTNKGELGSVICDTRIKGKSNNCTNEDISWWSDREKRFKENEKQSFREHPNDYFNEKGHQIPKVTDPDLIVWMRTAALPNFRKLYRKIEVDLKPGKYYIDVQNNFPMYDFGGEKVVILTTASIFGTKNWFLAVGYLTVAGVCLLLAVIFFVAYIFELLRSVTR